MAVGELDDQVGIGIAGGGQPAGGGLEGDARPVGDAGLGRDRQPGAEVDAPDVSCRRLGVVLRRGREAFGLGRLLQRHCPR